MCGIVGEIITEEDKRVLIFSRVRTLLRGLQHRGHETAGISGYDIVMAVLRTIKGVGEVVEAIPRKAAAEIWGMIAIGQNRYSTTGTGVCEGDREDDFYDSRNEGVCADKGTNHWKKNSQPFFMRFHRLGDCALNHNGNLINAADLKRRLIRHGFIFQGESDSEVILVLICYYVDKKGLSVSKAIRKAMSRIKGSFSCLFMTKDTLYAFRDKKGFRPLKIARTPDSIIVASEPCAWHARGAEYIRNIKPGEIVEVHAGNPEIKSHRAKTKSKRAFCIFEDIYLQAGYNLKVTIIRMLLGRRLFEKHSKKGIVIPILNSGEFAARGYQLAQRLVFPFISFIWPALYKNPNALRTFLEPENADRIEKNKKKYFLLFEPLREEFYRLPETENEIWLIFVDDSLVRSNVATTLIKIIRNSIQTLFPDIAHKFKIAWLLSSPPYCHPCYFGVDTYNQEELIAANSTEEEIRKKIGADYLGYLKLDEVLDIAAKVHGLKKTSFCHGCFSGEYPIPVDKEQHKMSCAG